MQEVYYKKLILIIENLDFQSILNAFSGVKVLMFPKSYPQMSLSAIVLTSCAPSNCLSDVTKIAFLSNALATIMLSGSFSFELFRMWMVLSLILWVTSMHSNSLSTLFKTSSSLCERFGYESSSISVIMDIKYLPLGSFSP